LNLDYSLVSFNDDCKYIGISDTFFPSLSKTERVFVILRPTLLKSQLNTQILKLFQINNFLLLKEKTKLLTQSEVNLLAHLENISEENMYAYLEIMLESEVQLLVFAKYGAVSEANLIANGCRNGRKRKSTNKTLINDPSSRFLNTNLQGFKTLFISLIKTSSS
jgi:nucleoside diphosphate kinase